MSTPRSDELLFAAGGDVWEKYGTFVKRTLPEEERGSFSRSSDATYTDRSGNLRTAESGVLRPHYVSSESSYSARLEAARTNSILHSEDFSDAAWSTNAASGAITADDADAPNGTTTADLIDDQDSGSTFRVFQSLTGQPDDSLDRAVSVFVKKKSGGAQVALELRFNGGTTERVYGVTLDPDTGSTSDSGTQSATRFGVEDYNSDWWRLWLVGSNNGSGNTEYRVDIRADAEGGTGSNHFWGAQLEGVSGGAAFPSSYIATAGSAVSRAVDDLSFPQSFGIQTLTIYLKVVDAGFAHTTVGAERGLLTNGSSGAGASSFTIRGNNNGSVLGQVNDDDDSFTTIVGISTSDPLEFGDAVEVRFVVDPDNQEITFEGAVDGSTLGESTKSTGPMTDWEEDTIWFGQFGSGPPGMADWITGPIIAPGVRTMDEMRSVEV